MASAANVLANPDMRSKHNLKNDGEEKKKNLGKGKQTANEITRRAVFCAVSGYSTVGPELQLCKRELLCEIRPDVRHHEGMAAR